MLETLSPGCSHGQILKSLAASDFILTEINHPAKSKISDHAHENAHFCFVLDGAYTESDAGRKFHCKPLSVTFRPSGEIHADNFDQSGARVFILEVPPKWLDRLAESNLKLDNSLQLAAGLLPQLISRVHHEFHNPDAAAPLVIEGLALEVLAHASRCSGDKAAATPKWLKQAVELLRSRYRETLTLEFIAAEVDIHPVHLAATFKQKYGCTVGEYVRQLRVEFVCREIIKGKNTLARIALDAGFANQSQLTKTFKRQLGTTPARYRNSV